MTNLPQNCIEIVPNIAHPADKVKGKWAHSIYTLVRFPGPGTYAMVDPCCGSIRTVGRRWAASVEILSIRQTLGLTQAEFAEAMHTSQTCVSRWESGDRGILGPTIKLARLLLERKEN